jgi:hypothetical protein
MALILTALLVPVFNVMARNHGDFQGKNGDQAAVAAQDEGQDAAIKGGHKKASAGNQAAENQPVVINMNQGSSGGHNRNYPSQQQQKQETQVSGNEPSYGSLQWTGNSQARQRKHGRMQAQQFTAPVLQDNRTAGKNNITINRQVNINKAQVTNVKEAGVAHHNPVQQVVIREKLKKLGVKAQPGYIMNRAEVIHTDREHSRIVYPKTGFDNRPIKAVAISPRQFNDKIVKTNMSLVVSVTFQNKILQFDRTERQVNRYYWHNDRNLNYCHYIDTTGYHWYGWYTGNKYFWTRHFNNRWWWYDADFDRWCFWNNGFW